MLVSAISANKGLAVSLNSNYRFVNSRGGDTTDTTTQPTDTDRDLSKLYDSINKWKYVCHEQIEAGNLDFLA